MSLRITEVLVRDSVLRTVSPRTSNPRFETAKRLPDLPYNSSSCRDMIEIENRDNLFDHTTYTFGTSYHQVTSSTITARFLPPVTITIIHRLPTSCTNTIQRVIIWKLSIRLPEHFHRAARLLPCNHILPK